LLSFDHVIFAALHHCCPRARDLHTAIDDHL
jgi:hypothetical protein